MHSSASYHENDFSKTVLKWSFEVLAAPLHIAMRQAPLPSSEYNIANYYGNFLPLILEEARAIIASGLEKVDQYAAQSSRRRGHANISHLADAKPFNLQLKKNASLPRNEGNPLSMTFSGAIPDEIEHGKSMNVLLLRTKGINPEKSFIALTTENNNASELFIKIIISSADYASYARCFIEGRHWQAQYLGSVVSEQRMYDACLEASNIPCVQQIARSNIQRPQTARTSTGSVDVNHLNLSQREAIYAFLNAREGSTVLLQGPPGTGKTTTVVSLLKILALQHKRTMVSAHSNKGVQVLALRAVSDMPDVPMILVGVESKLHDKLKPIFLNGWYDILYSYFSSYHDEIELLATNPSTAVGMSITALIKEISAHINEAQQALTKFNLIHTRRASEGSNAALSALGDDPLLMSDFQTIRNHINEIKTQPQSKNKWAILLGSLNRLIAKWDRVNKAELEAYLLDRAEIVFSTLVAAGRKSMLSMVPIDYLLVDEAAQSVEAATLIPMRFQPNKVLLVGDTKQLPATVISPALDDSSARRSSSNYKWSMMWRLIEECNQPSLMLTIQYRMHPHICQWPSSQYYADRLITSPDILPMPALSNTSIISRPYAIYQISGHAESLHGSHSICNTQEAQYVIKIIEHIRRQNKEHTIGVITPYAAQKSVIIDGLSKKKPALPLVDVNTVDGFQGDERDIIIISFTRTHVSEFLKEFRRLNVAITRPKSCLIILGAATLLSNDIGQLMADAKLRKVLHSEQDLKNILATGAVPSLALQSNVTVDLRTAAWQGHASSQFNYAQNIAATNPALAFIWYRRAAENNDPEAQYYIGQLYLSDNNIVKKDTQLGIAWVHKAAQKHLPLAQFAIGQQFLSGLHIVKNVATGIFWCEQAASNDLVTAIVFLAKCNEEGLHIAQNITKAQNLYRRAAKLDDLPAAIRLAELLANGTPENQNEAIKWYRKTAARNATATYYPLAVLLHNVNNQIEALQWYLKAAEIGDVDAQYELGMRFKHGYHNCNIDIPKSTYFFQLAAASGHTHAQFIYATCLMEGSGVAVNKREAMEIFQKAADKGHVEAQYQFALLKSQEAKHDAYPYFLKAAHQNHFLAQYECISYQVQYGRDLAYCLQFCQQQVSQANPTVLFLLARLLDTGIAGKTDKTVAFRYYLQVITSHPQAQYYCAVMLEDGIGVSQNLTQARQYYEACLDICPEAKLRLARLLLQVETYADHEVRAIELLKSYYANFQQTHPSTSQTLEGQLESFIVSRASNSRSICFVYSIVTSSIYANYALGMMLKEGAGVAQNHTEAMIFLKRAADKGDAESQYQFALLKSQQSKNEAYPYFKKAALQQHVLAQNECIHHQITNNYDLTFCLIFCEQQAAKGNQQAQFLAARILDTGIISKTNKTQAYHYYSPLAESRHALSQYYCALILEQGIAVPQDLTKARFYYESCMEQCFFARFKLACLLLQVEHNEQQNRGANIAQVEDNGVACLPFSKDSSTNDRNKSIALTQDQTQAIELLEFYFNHYPKDKAMVSDTLEHRLEELIIQHYSSYVVNTVPAIATHAIQANYFLGRIFQEGKGVAIDIQRALQHYTLASTQQADACYRIGYIYETGQNVAKNWSTAKRFYQSAEDKGHKLAAMRLTWSYSFFTSSNNPPTDDALLANAKGNCVIS